MDETPRPIIKIFIASAAELKEEREKCIFVINQLNDSLKSPHLEPVEWEYNILQSINPDSEAIQDSIYSKLKECDLAVFLVYTRLGSKVLKEIQYAIAEKKRIWIFFKKGITSESGESQSFKVLLNLKNRSLEGPERLRIHPFKNLTNLGIKFKISLYDQVLPPKLTTPEPIGSEGSKPPDRQKNNEPTRRKRADFPGIGSTIASPYIAESPSSPRAVESTPATEPMDASVPDDEQVKITEHNDIPPTFEPKKAFWRPRFPPLLRGFARGVRGNLSNADISRADISDYDSPIIKLKRAFRQLDIPRPMKVGKTYRVKLAVARQIDQLISSKDTIDIKEITIANQVKVTLVGEKFNILSLNNSNQKLVTDNQPSEWNWDVTPKSSGIQKLIVIVSTIINIPNEGNTEQEIKLSEETVKVLVNIPYSTVYIIKTYWQWVIGLLAGTGVLWKVIDYFSQKK